MKLKIETRLEADTIAQALIEFIDTSLKASGHARARPYEDSYYIEQREVVEKLKRFVG